MTKPKENPSRSVSMLDRMEFFALGNYLKANQPRLEAEKKSYQQAAEEATTELGFTITTGNLKSACKDLGITWAESQSPSKNSILIQIKNIKDAADAATIRCEGIENTLRKFVLAVNQDEMKLVQQQAEIAVLRRLVHHLYQQLDCNPPPGFQLPIFEKQSVTGK